MVGPSWRGAVHFWRHVHLVFIMCSLVHFKRTQQHNGARLWTVPVVNVVSCGVDVPPGLRGVGDLRRLGDQMLNIPPCQLRTGARHMKQNIIKHAIPSVRVLHRAKPQRKHFNCVWYSEKNPAGSSPWTGWLFYRANGTLSLLTCNSHFNVRFY